MKFSTPSDKNIQNVEFRLEIGREDYLLYYSGVVKSVKVISLCGRKVQFPANLLTPFVSHAGVYGNFVLSYECSGKVVSLLKKTY